MHSCHQLKKHILLYVCIVIPICRERKYRIAVDTMAGVIPQTAEQDVLDSVIASYFMDDLHKFINEFKLPKDQVCVMEDKIIKHLSVSSVHNTFYCQYNKTIK